MAVSFTSHTPVFTAVTYYRKFSKTASTPPRSLFVETPSCTFPSGRCDAHVLPWSHTANPIDMAFCATSAQNSINNTLHFLPKITMDFFPYLAQGLVVVPRSEPSGPAYIELDTSDAPRYLLQGRCAVIGIWRLDRLRNTTGVAPPLAIACLQSLIFNRNTTGADLFDSASTYSSKQ